jgi:SAM-dependent methyltransferase
MLHDDRIRAESFGADAARYHRARPSYPSAVIDALLAEAPHRVLEVGCGTGIASRLLAERGCEVLGVEPDARMAAVARSVASIEVELSSFESWDRRDRQFELLASAQAWHWIEPSIGAAAAAAALLPGGRVGLFWNVGRPPADLKTAFATTYAKLAPGLEQYSVLLGHRDDRFEKSAHALRAVGGFTDVAVDTFPHSVTYSTDEWLDHLPTHSDHATLPPERRERLLGAIGAIIDGQGGSFSMGYDTVLITGRRRTSK